jgi:hypothetical protein
MVARFFRAHRNIAGAARIPLVKHPSRAAAKGRPINALLANAGRGLGKGFLDQDWTKHGA